MRAWHGPILWLSLPALAHDGHGVIGAHWHASDLWGLAVALVAAALWWLRGRR